MHLGAWRTRWKILSFQPRAQAPVSFSTPFFQGSHGERLKTARPFLAVSNHQEPLQQLCRRRWLVRSAQAGRIGTAVESCALALRGLGSFGGCPNFFGGLPGHFCSFGRYRRREAEFLQANGTPLAKSSLRELIGKRTGAFDVLSVAVQCSRL